MIRILPRGSTKTIALLGDEQETTALWLAMQKVEHKRKYGKKSKKPQNTHKLFAKHVYGKHGSRLPKK